MADDFGTPVKIPGPAPIPADQLPNPRLGERLSPEARSSLEQIEDNFRHAEWRIGGALRSR